MLHLYPSELEAVYECIRSFRPFKSWRLPHADEVIFKIADRTDCEGEMVPEVGAPRILISSLHVGHYDTLHRVMAHEMVHLAQLLSKEPDWHTHGAGFQRRAKVVCRYLGWDPKEF